MKIFNLFILSLLLFSCSKDLLEESTVKEVVSTNYVTFESNKALNDFFKSDQTPGDYGLILDFPLLTDHKKNSLELIENARDLAEVNDIISKSHNTLSLIEDEHGELEVAETISERHPFFQLLNLDGIVKAGDKFYRLLDEYMLVGSDYEMLAKVKNISKLPQEISSFIAVEIENDNTRWGDASRSWYESLHNLNGNCKNYRRLEFNFKTVKTTFQAQAVPPYIPAHTQVKLTGYSDVIAKRKNWTCVLFRYSTEIRWNNFYAKYDSNFNGSITSNNEWFGSDILDYSAQCRDRTKTILFYVQEWDTFDMQWREITTDATHLGMAGDWLNFNYTF